MGGGKKFTNTNEKDPSKVVGEGSLSTGGTRTARAARAKKEQNSNNNSDSKSLNDITNGVKEATENAAAKKSTANKNTSSKPSSETSNKKTESTNKDNPISFYIGRRRIPVEEAQKEIDRLVSEIETMRDTITNNEIVFNDLQQDNKIFGEGTDALVNRNRELNRERDDLQEQKDILQKILDRKNGKIFTEEPKSVNSENFEETKIDTSEPKAEEVKTDNSDEGSSSRDVDAELREIFKAVKEGRIEDAQKLADQAAKKYGGTSEPKVDNSGTTEETVAPTSEPKAANSEFFEETATPETGEAKVEGEPKANTEQAQATQESTKKANARPGTGEPTKDNVMSPEDAFKFFNDKNNYERASTVFKTPSFDRYIDSTTGKWIPRSYFDAFNARDGINPKDFTFEHFKAKIPKDPGKPLTAEEETADIYNTNKAADDYDKKYESFNTGFKAYLRRHPKLEKIVKTGKIVGGVSLLYGLGQMLNDAFIAGQSNKDEVQDIAKSLNDDDPEPLVGNVNNNNSPENIAAQLKGADESTGTPEDNSGTIEQAIAEQAPAGNAEPGKPQVAADAATPANTKANKANKAPASTAKSAPTKDTTQGLPPVVVNNTPPANAGSKDMTYSQRVEAGQTPQEGANNPDLVTAGLLDAMNQNPQAGSDAIGYGDLYDQNFIDYWAKRNPNLAFGVSQGRR